MNILYTYLYKAPNTPSHRHLNPLAQHFAHAIINQIILFSLFFLYDRICYGVVFYFLQPRLGFSWNVTPSLPRDERQPLCSNVFPEKAISQKKVFGCKLLPKIYKLAMNIFWSIESSYLVWYTVRFLRIHHLMCRSSKSNQLNYVKICIVLENSHSGPSENWKAASHLCILSSPLSLLFQTVASTHKFLLPCVFVWQSLFIHATQRHQNSCW